MMQAMLIRRGQSPTVEAEVAEPGGEGSHGRVEKMNLSKFKTNIYIYAKSIKTSI